MKGQQFLFWDDTAHLIEMTKTKYGPDWDLVVFSLQIIEDIQ